MPSWPVTRHRTPTEFDGYAVTSVIGVPAGMTLADILVPAGLADNGGPTQTIALALVAGNPAIDTGSATCVEAPVSLLDQRGMSRLPGPSCDIGAYEAQLPTLAAAGDIPVWATSAAGAAVSFASPAGTDEQGGAADVACLPASGSTFAVGTTTVTCTAADAVGHSATGTFQVIVGAVVPPASNNPAPSATPTATPAPLPDTAASDGSPGPLVPVLAVVVLALAVAVRIKEGVVSRQ